MDESELKALGTEMFSLATELYPICRSITGDGVRKTLRILRSHTPEMRIEEVPSGTACFDWVVPLEWNIREAWIADQAGRRIVDFRDHNLHVVSYSEPVDRTVTLDELQPHLHSLPAQPDVIPYVTSYYERYWGFCLTDRQRRELGPGPYRVRIDSSLEDGHLTYGEVLMPGETDEEVLLSTYVCHPSMANNEVSGPVVTAFLLKWLALLPRRRYTYRAIFIPETIGSIVYLSRNLAQMRPRTVAGFNVTCVGDERAYSYLPSRRGDTLADRVALHVLRHTAGTFKAYSFLDRGSDERQYCSPGVDLPVASVMRTKYGEYPEYHTSADDLKLISPDGLAGAYAVLRRCLECIEGDITYVGTTTCEPFMKRRGLRPTLGGRGIDAHAATTMHVLAYADGTRDLLGIADVLGVPMWELLPIAEALVELDLLRPTPTREEGNPRFLSRSD